MKLPFKQPKLEDEADKKPVMSDAVRRAIAQAALDIDSGRSRPRSQKREEREIFADGYWQPARRRIDIGRPW